MSRERIPLTFEVEISLEPPDKSQRDRLVQPWRAEILLGGRPTGAYAIAESSQAWGPPDRFMKEHLVEHAIRSFVGRMNKALTIARGDVD